MNREVVTLSLGSLASHVSAKLWDLQISLCECSHAADGESEDRFVTPMITSSTDKFGSPVYRPRTVLCSLGGGFGDLSVLGGGRSYISASSVRASNESLRERNGWMGAIRQVNRVDSMALRGHSSPYLSRQTSDLLSGGDVMRSEEPTTSKRLVPPSWSRLRQHPPSQRCLVELADVGSIVQEPDLMGTYWQGHAAYQTTVETSLGVGGGGSGTCGELVEDSIRRVVEGCDMFQGFQTLVDVDNGWGGFSARLLETLRDDYSRRGFLTYGLSGDDPLRVALRARGRRQRPTVPVWSPTSYLSMAGLLPHSDLFVPLVCEGGASQNSPSFRTSVNGAAAAVHTLSMSFGGWGNTAYHLDPDTLSRTGVTKTQSSRTMRMTGGDGESAAEATRREGRNVAGRVGFAEFVGRLKQFRRGRDSEGAVVLGAAMGYVQPNKPHHSQSGVQMVSGVTGVMERARAQEARARRNRQRGGGGGMTSAWSLAPEPLERKSVSPGVHSESRPKATSAGDGDRLDLPSAHQWSEDTEAAWTIMHLPSKLLGAPEMLKRMRRSHPHIHQALLMQSSLRTAMARTAGDSISPRQFTPFLVPMARRAVMRSLGPAVQRSFLSKEEESLMRVFQAAFAYYQGEGQGKGKGSGSGGGGGSDSKGESGRGGGAASPHRAFSAQEFYELLLAAGKGVSNLGRGNRTVTTQSGHGSDVWPSSILAGLARSQAQQVMCGQVACVSAQGVWLVAAGVRDLLAQVDGMTQDLFGGAAPPFNAWRVFCQMMGLTLPSSSVSFSEGTRGYISYCERQPRLATRPAPAKSSGETGGTGRTNQPSSNSRSNNNNNNNNHNNSKDTSQSQQGPGYTRAAVTCALLYSPAFARALVAQGLHTLQLWRAGRRTDSVTPRSAEQGAASRLGRQDGVSGVVITSVDRIPQQSMRLTRRVSSRRRNELPRGGRDDDEGQDHHLSRDNTESLEYQLRLKRSFRRWQLTAGAQECADEYDRLIGVLRGALSDE